MRSQEHTKDLQKYLSPAYSQTKRVSTQNLMHFLFLSAADPTVHSQGVLGSMKWLQQ